MFDYSGMPLFALLLEPEAQFEIIAPAIEKPIEAPSITAEIIPMPSTPPAPTKPPRIKAPLRATFTLESPHALLEKDKLTLAEQSQLLNEYVSRGRALKIQGDRGIIDSHIRRENHLGQFFTPLEVVQVMMKALSLCDHESWEGKWTMPRTCSVVDFAGCGIGRMLQYFPYDWYKAGADIDPLAVRAAKLIYPEAEIIEANLVNLRIDRKAKAYDLAIINPPFSIRLNSEKPLDLCSAEWGIWGKNTSVSSHWAALEMALRVAHTTAIILPTTALEGDNAKTFEKIQKEYGRHGNENQSLAFRMDLPPSAFKSEGTEWPCSILIFTNTHGSSVHYECPTWDEVEGSLSEWISQLKEEWQEYKDNDYHWHRSLTKAFREYKDSPIPSLASFLSAPQAKPVAPTAIEANTGDMPCVRMCLGGRGHRIVLKPNNLIARLAIQEARLWHGWMTSDGFHPQNMLDWACDLVRNAGSATENINDVANAIESIGGIRVSIDRQLKTYAKRADLRTSIELNRHSQWIRIGDDWEKQGQDDIEAQDHPAKTQIASRFDYFSYNAQCLASGLRVNQWNGREKKHVPIQYPAIPIYEFSVRDIARTLGRRSVIYSAKQGLAKTRFSIGTVLASGTSKALWILESRLVNEFKRELRKVGLLKYFHLIDSASDLKHLNLINVITYSRLWKSVSGKDTPNKNWGPGKSFAAALAKRRMPVILDEAHKIKSAVSKQGIAARYLCQRAKRVILMTGTAIQSYPRNILGLCNAGWGDGSSMNPYGYRRPMEGGYEVPGKSYRYRQAIMKGVTQFVDEFVDVIWYTAQFAQTGSTGQKSREIPRIKNLSLWKSFVSPKLIRRVPNEPEVRASGVSTPEAKPQFKGIDPSKSHFTYYKLVLDHFASIWKERLEREKKGVSENSIAHILPELDALRFASTVPIVDHRWHEDSILLKNNRFKEPTAVMMEALKLINDWVTAGDRVIIGSEKPSALEWLADLLSDLPKHIPDSEPIESILALDSNIERRNEAIDKARDDENVPVLLISVGKGKEGLNLPEFAKLLTLDFGWVPGDLDQFRHRILRPGQTGDVEIVHLYHEGMIDSYMRQLCDAKSDAIAEVIDGQESTFDYSTWKDYRTFALEMLSKEGYKFATIALTDHEIVKTA